MSRQTSFSLEVTKYDDSPSDSVMTIERLIHDIQSGQKMTKAILIKTLKEISQTKRSEVTPKDIIKALRDENENAAYGLTEDGYSKADLVWFNHEQELKEFSTKYPGWLITLSFEGDEPHDIWRKYFLNGKLQAEKAKIIIDDFNPDKLV